MGELLFTLKHVMRQKRLSWVLCCIVQFWHLSVLIYVYKNYYNDVYYKPRECNKVQLFFSWYFNINNDFYDLSFEMLPSH